MTANMWARSWAGAGERKAQLGWIVL